MNEASTTTTEARCEADLDFSLDCNVWLAQLLERRRFWLERLEKADDTRARLRARNALARCEWLIVRIETRHREMLLRAEERSACSDGGAPRDHAGYGTAATRVSPPPGRTLA